MISTNQTYDLPEGLVYPSSRNHDQRSLFRVPLSRAISQLAVSEDDLRRWRAMGWLSFDCHPDELVDEFDDSKVAEIEVIRDISRSGISDAWITRALKQLPRPLSHQASSMLYHFRHGWLALELPAPADPAEVLAAYLAELTEQEDIEALQEIQQTIAQALNQISTPEEES